MQQVWSLTKGLWRFTWRTARMGPMAIFMLPMAMLMFASYAFILVGVLIVLIGFALPCALLASPLLLPILLAKLFVGHQRSRRSGGSSQPQAAPTTVQYYVRKRKVLGSMDAGRRVKAERWYGVAEQATRMDDVATARYAWSRIDGLRS